MKDIDKLKILKKMYKILSKLIEKYALPKYGYFCGHIWYDEVQEILKYIDISIEEKQDIHKILIGITYDNSKLYNERGHSDFDEFSIKEKDIIKRKKLNKFLEHVKDRIWGILMPYIDEKYNISK